MFAIIFDDDDDDDDVVVVDDDDDVVVVVDDDDDRGEEFKGALLALLKAVLSTTGADGWVWKKTKPGTTGSLGNQILGVSLRYLWVDEKVPILSLTDYQVVWDAGLRWRGQALPIRSRPIQNVWMCHSSRPMEPQILVIYKCQIEAMLSPQFWATPTYQPLMVGHPVTQQVPCGVSEFTKALGRATFG